MPIEPIRIEAVLQQTPTWIEDFEKGVAFYRDILGLPFLFAAPPQMAFLNCGGVRLLVSVLPPGQTPPIARV
jgi:methylmalonyl-CoA/ethylmalonyl-CoA epimerase